MVHGIAKFGEGKLVARFQLSDDGLQGAARRLDAVPGHGSRTVDEELNCNIVRFTYRDTRAETQ